MISSDRVGVAQLGLHYEEYGESHSPLIVFIHGGGVSGWMWDKQVQYFQTIIV